MIHLFSKLSLLDKVGKKSSPKSRSIDQTLNLMRVAFVERHEDLVEDIDEQQDQHDTHEQGGGAHCGAHCWCGVYLVVTLSSMLIYTTKGITNCPTHHDHTTLWPSTIVTWHFQLSPSIASLLSSADMTSISFQSASPPPKTNLQRHQPW